MFLTARLLTVSLILAVPVSAQAESPSAPEATMLGLEYVKEAGKAWMSKRGCVSCHQVPSMIWSHEAAFRNGVEISTDELAKWKSWSTNVVNFVKPAQKDDVDHQATMESNIDTMVAMLLAIPAEPSREWRTKFASTLVATQAEDGSWQACGQLPMQRRPERETHAVTTLWTAYALLEEGTEFRQDAAIAFSDEIKKAVSTEWYATRLLISQQLVDANIEGRRRRLLDHQNDDGGWGWRVGESSDALGTGYALYALAKTGAETSDVMAAREYLLRTQTQSGKWIVPGTKKSAKGKPTATATDWGTAWALIALSESQ